jgi:putative serine protease PepD
MSTRSWVIPAGLLVMLVLAGLAGAFIADVGHHPAPTTTVIQRAPAGDEPATRTGTWRAMYAAVAPGIVDITAEVTTTVPTPFGERQTRDTALGSGFVLSTDGEIVTAAHVVADATAIRAAFASGERRTATLVGRDDAADVAVIRAKVTGLTLKPLTLGSSKSLAVGDALAIIGDPLGFHRSLSTGVVSGLDRTIEAPNGFEIAHAIQTDAAMNPGNSGGPLLDSTGSVIGIADQIATGTNQFGGSSTTSTGVGFAVPIDLIKAELPALRRGERVTHAYLGVETASTTTTASGAQVGGVLAGSPAADAGIRVGDVIVAWNGRVITGPGALIEALSGAHPGDHARVTVLRGTERVDVSVMLGTQPTQAPSG